MRHSLFLMMVVSFLFTTSCYDDSFIREQLKNHEERISELESLCLKINTNISSLQAVLDALQKNDYVSSMVPITEAGKEVGYVLVFTSGKSVTIYHGKDGADGKDGVNGTDGKDGEDGADGKDGLDGKDGYTPVIGVRKDTDGIYYWTLDGEWLLDEDGNKIKAVGTDGKDGQDGADGSDGKDGANGTDGIDGIDGSDGKDGLDGEDGAPGSDGEDGVTPQLKIADDYWYVSYDNGLTWIQLGKATGENGADGADGKDGSDGDSFFQSVSQDQNYVYLILKDGTEILIPKSSGTVPAVSPDVILSLDKISMNTAIFSGEVIKKSVDMKVTVYYGTSADLTLYNNEGNVSVSSFHDTSFTLSVTDLKWETEYYYFIETLSGGVKSYSEVASFSIGAEPYLRLTGGSSSTSFYYSFDGVDSNVANLDTNVDEFTVIIPEDATWIEDVLIDMNNPDGPAVVFYVSPNKGEDQRQTDVRIAYAMNPDLYVTFTIVQDVFTGLNGDIPGSGNRYLIYHPNSYSYTTNVTINSADVYNYCSVINVSDTFSTRDKVECKLQFDKDLTASSTSHYLCGNSSYTIYFNQYGMRFSYVGDSDNHLPGGSYSWSDLGMTSTMNPMVLIFDSGNLTVNGNTIYDIPWDITGNYLFSSYYYDSDGGKYVDYDGIGDGTRLYYAKMWDNQGRLIYVGYPDQAVNPATGNMEYCWASRSYSSSSGTVITKNEFAYYNSALSEYVPYGGSF